MNEQDQIDVEKVGNVYIDARFSVSIWNIFLWTGAVVASARIWNWIFDGHLLAAIIGWR